MPILPLLGSRQTFITVITLGVTNYFFSTSNSLLCCDKDGSPQKQTIKLNH